MTTMIRRSLLLTPAQWAALERLAELLEARSQRGPTAGKPSWRVLVAMIADGILAVNAGDVVEAVDKQPPL